MKFTKLIKNAYFLLEQDQQQNATAPQTDVSATQPPSAAVTVDPNQSSQEVQNSEEGLLEVAKKLILCFKQIIQANDLKERDSLIKDLMDASKGEASVALQQISKVCDEYSQQTVPQQF